MSDTWKDIQDEKNRKNSMQERRKRYKKFMAAFTETATVDMSSTTKTNKPITDAVPLSKSSTISNNGNLSSAGNSGHFATDSSTDKSCQERKNGNSSNESSATEQLKIPTEKLTQVEQELHDVLSDISLNFPMDATQLMTIVSRRLSNKVQIPIKIFDNLLHKLAAQQLISLNMKEDDRKGESLLSIESADTTKLLVLCGGEDDKQSSRKRKPDSEAMEEVTNKHQKLVTEPHSDSVESLLATHTTKERENKKVNEEILQLLSKPTAKEQSLVEKFKSHGGASVQEFCQFGTVSECQRATGQNTPCDKLHFKKIINPHTDESLGDCSFLNTCFHMATCKYVHYEINTRAQTQPAILESKTDVQSKHTQESTVLFPPQWVSCDVRKLDMSVLGKFAIIMADPPWDIHMELPYGTMGDDEMRSLDVPSLQDEGYIFLWVTGRAMELGRECLRLWGYERVDELIWVKTNQLQRIIRTGRTGHWLNHGKEHCLVGVKGEPATMNRGLDCDVIVAEVRATSHKPDEIYGIIERLSPGTRKIELFGRPHNVQPNWITLGNQLDGVRLIDPEVVRAFKKRYPDGSSDTYT